MHASIMGEWPAIRWGVHEWASGRQDRTHFASPEVPESDFSTKDLQSAGALLKSNT